MKKTLTLAAMALAAAQISAITIDEAFAKFSAAPGGQAVTVPAENLQDKDVDWCKFVTFYGDEDAQQLDDIVAEITDPMFVAGDKVKGSEMMKIFTKRQPDGRTRMLVYVDMAVAGNRTVVFMQGGEDCLQDSGLGASVTTDCEDCDD